MSTPQDRGRSYEKELAKEMGEKTNPGSGNLFYAPRDIKSKAFLMEAKFTGQPHYVFELEDWNKFERQGIGSIPVLLLGFYGGKEYAILDIYDWHSLPKPKELFHVKVKPKKGLTCARLNRRMLGTDVRRLNAGEQSIVNITFPGGESFIIVPKQTFYTIKQLHERGE